MLKRYKDNNNEYLVTKWEGKDIKGIIEDIKIILCTPFFTVDKYENKNIKNGMQITNLDEYFILEKGEYLVSELNSNGRVFIYTQEKINKLQEIKA